MNTKDKRIVLILSIIISILLISIILYLDYNRGFDKIVDESKIASNNDLN
jgi:hypothetical protein